MPNLVYPGIPGAPAYQPAYGSPPAQPVDHTPPANGGGGGGTTPPPDMGGGGGGTTPPPDTTGGGAPSGGDGSGLISVHGSDGGIDAHVVDTDGDHSGLIDVHSDATSGVAGTLLDGTHIDVVNPDSLIDAHVPNLVDATVGDGTVSNIIGGVTDGDGIGDAGGVPNVLQGIEIDALHDGNLLDVHAPGLADATVGGSELGGLLGGVGDASPSASGLEGITVEALNGESLAEVHAGNIVDATVGGGTELSGILGSVGDTANSAGESAGDLGLTVEALNGDYLAEAHVPGTLDATVGGAELGNLVGGADLGGIDTALTGGDLLGDALHVGSGGDIAGIDLGHTLDNIGHI